MNRNHLFAVIAAVVTAAMPLTACGNGSAEKNDLTIVTTVYATYDFAKQLTGEFDGTTDCCMLLTPGGESHSYEPSPADVAKIQSCDLFVYIGGASEQWAEKLIETSRKDKPNLRMFDYVDLLDEEHKEGMEAEEEPDLSHGDDTETDEHIWTAPLNADQMALAIHDKLNEIVPDEKAHCDAAFDRLHSDLLDLDAQAQEIRDSAQKNTLVFADRFPFRYLTDAYGWDYYAAFAGCSSDTDASAATLSFLISKVKEEQIGTVFYLENSSQKISDAVCAATGAEAVMMHSLNNVSTEEFQSNVHYQDLMQQNLDAIREALS
ncbi:MAG TPA: zinc ABC transporter substrate-binding protein [Ruminococcus sp.]|nr:zinc ABC transporter substrate-binding protein [Ruminococcus sp.]